MKMLCCQELRDYIASTYGQHYSAGNDSIQTLDLIEACGDAEAFCRSNILKYASRYDKKGTARRDIVKILHYGLLLYISLTRLTLLNHITNEQTDSISDTHQILKNFATINSSIMINAGNVLKTISVGENSIAEFKCEESFPQTFGIYDLSEFLTGMSLFDSPVLEFQMQ